MQIPRFKWPMRNVVRLAVPFAHFSTNVWISLIRYFHYRHFAELFRTIFIEIYIWIWIAFNRCRRRHRPLNDSSAAQLHSCQLVCPRKTKNCRAFSYQHEIAIMPFGNGFVCAWWCQMTWGAERKQHFEWPKHFLPLPFQIRDGIDYILCCMCVYM